MTYDLEQLKLQTKKVLDYSDDGNYKVERLLDRWAQNKQQLIDEFGGKLILESGQTMTLDMPAEDKVIRYHEYLDDIAFMTANEELRAFLVTQGWEAFYANSVRETWDKYGVRIQKGAKITKALKLFIKDVKELDKWQIRYSRLIQDVKICGELCLSVHPLDYLSISESTHNWRSCHSLDGEYRAGNLSYMVDEVTIVAYLKSKGEHKLPGFPSEVLWNSKKWRMLFYINKDRDLIFSSKPYPFDNMQLVNASYDMLQEAIGNKWPSEFTYGPEEVLYDYIDDHPQSVHFNDCLSSATYTPRFKCAHGNDNIYKVKSRVIVGDVVHCLQCEKDEIEFGADYSCYHCGDYTTCSCGCHIFTYEAQYLDGEYYCPSCYDDLVIWCNDCGKAHSRENPTMTYEQDDEEWYCPACYDAKIHKKE